MRKAIILFLAIVATVTAVPASAQMFRGGVIAGVAVNRTGDNYRGYDPVNKSAFTGGVTAEVNLLNIPVIGVGFELSMLYERRRVAFVSEGGQGAAALLPRSRSYIQIPLNLKWKLGLPGISKVIDPFLTTGPGLGFLVGHREKYDDKRIWSWNIGFGIELFRHLQVKGSYAIPMSRSVVKADADDYWALPGGGRGAYYKDHCWTWTATWFF